MASKWVLVLSSPDPGFGPGVSGSSSGPLLAVLTGWWLGSGVSTTWGKEDCLLCHRLLDERDRRTDRQTKTGRDRPMHTWSGRGEAQVVSSHLASCRAHGSPWGLVNGNGLQQWRQPS